MADNKITIIRGDNVTIPVTFTDENGDPVDITWYTVFFTVKTFENIKSDITTDDGAVIKKDITSHTSPTTWQTQVVLDNDDTDIENREYYWDLQLKSPWNIITSTLKWVLCIESDVTRRTT